MTTNAYEPCLTLTSPADVLAAVPYLVGFHPVDSLVVIGLDRGRAKVAARWGCRCRRARWRRSCRCSSGRR